MKRTLYVAALLAFVLISALCSTPARADSHTVVLRAHGNPNLVDFFALSAKRADLQIDMARKGLDAAFTGWLRRDRPHLYRHFADRQGQDERSHRGEGR